MISACKPPTFRPQIKPKRLRSEKYMTVTVGFLCADGVVLGADSQESYEGSALKRSVPKLVSFPPFDQNDIFLSPPPQTPDRRAIFTGAGDAALVDKVIDELWAEIATADPSVSAIAAAIERRITELYGEYRELYHPGYMPSAQITFGIWCAGESQLFHASGPLVNKIGKMGSSFGYKSAGIGSEITDYIQGRMRVIPSKVDDAIVLATYMLEQAVAHAEGCGGDIRLVWLRNDGTADIAEVDQYTTLILKGLDNQISKAILAAANPKYTDKVVDMVLKHATQSIFKLRAKQREAMEKAKQDKEEFDRAIEEINRLSGEGKK